MDVCDIISMKESMAIQIQADLIASGEINQITNPEISIATSIQNMEERLVLTDIIMRR
ncbi:MAG TPA: hypothetical protein VFG10_19285 [Saprospiraceae bacterium]|nr:hypothetical protein [Saprospiraceae bacterium]